MKREFTLAAISVTAVFLFGTPALHADSSRPSVAPSPEAIQRLIDLEEIRKLHLDYAAYQETLDLDGLMTLFTDDVVLVYPKEYGGEWTGIERIRKNFAEAMKNEKMPFNALYVLTNPNITITAPDRAHGRWTFTNYPTAQSEGDEYTTVGGQNQPLYILAMYEDEYRKVNGQWKISRPKLTRFWPSRDYKALAHP